MRNLRGLDARGCSKDRLWVKRGPDLSTVLMQHTPGDRHGHQHRHHHPHHLHEEPCASWVHLFVTLSTCQLSASTSALTRCFPLWNSCAKGLRTWGDIALFSFHGFSASGGRKHSRDSSRDIPTLASGFLPAGLITGAGEDRGLRAAGTDRSSGRHLATERTKGLGSEHRCSRRTNSISSQMLVLRASLAPSSRTPHHYPMSVFSSKQVLCFDRWTLKIVRRPSRLSFTGTLSLVKKLATLGSGVRGDRVKYDREWLGEAGVNDLKFFTPCLRESWWFPIFVWQYKVKRGRQSLHQNHSQESQARNVKNTSSKRTSGIDISVCSFVNLPNGLMRKLNEYIDMTSKYQTLFT